MPALFFSTNHSLLNTTVKQQRKMVAKVATYMVKYHYSMSKSVYLVSVIWGYDEIQVLRACRRHLDMLP